MARSRIGEAVTATGAEQGRSDWLLLNRAWTGTEKIIGGAFAVSNGLGHGFLKSVYKNALMVELEARDLSARKEQSFPVHYREKQVGFYLADLVVEKSGDH